MTRKNVAAFFAVSLLWGSSWIIESGYRGLLPPLRSQALCLGIAAALLALLVLLRRARWPRGSAFRASLLLGFSMVALPPALVLWASAWLSGGLTATLFAFLPLLAIFAALLFPAADTADTPSRARNAAVCGIGGIALLVSVEFDLSSSQIPALIAVLATVAIQAVSLVYAKKHLGGAHPSATAAIQLAIGAVLLELASVATEHANLSHWSTTAALTLLISSLTSGLALTLLYWLLKRCEPYQVATLQWSQSLVTVAEGALLLRERPPLTAIIGASVVLGSLIAAFFVRDEAAEALTLKVTPHPPHE